MYEKDGIQYARKYGSREDVIARTVYCTSGKLTLEDLEQRGKRIISKKRSALGKARYKKQNPFTQDAKDTSDDEKVESVVVPPIDVNVVSAKLSVKLRDRKRRRRRGPPARASR